MAYARAMASTFKAEGMTEVNCDCGSVKLEVAAEPAGINDYQCSRCQRLGALWAY
jgi:hypothetical protein